MAKRFKRVPKTQAKMRPLPSSREAKAGATRREKTTKTPTSFTELARVREKKTKKESS